MRMLMMITACRRGLLHIRACWLLESLDKLCSGCSGVFCYQSGNTDNVFLGWLHIHWRSMLHVSMEWRMHGQKNSQMEGDKQKTQMPETCLKHSALQVSGE